MGADRPGISCAEKGQQQPLGSEHALQLARERSAATRSRKSKMSQQRIPLDRLSLVRKARVEEGPELIELALDDMAIDVLGEILEADLAADLFAEEGDIGADNRPEIQEHRVAHGR